MSDIFTSLPILILMPFLATIFILTSKKEQVSNIYNVCLFTIIANMVLVLRFFYLIDPTINKLQLIDKFEWLKYLGISFVFGADAFSLFLILAIHLAFLVMLYSIKYDTEHPKTLSTYAMLFLSMITGLLISNDLFSFYLFFEALLLPLFLLIGIGGGIKKQEKIYPFFLYNMFFSFLFFIAIVLLFNYSHQSYIMSNIKEILLDNKMLYFIWISILLSLLSRLPIWPFHRVLSSMNSELKNPLVFLVSNLMPITAIYGFIRILPHNVDSHMGLIILILQILSIISVAFISLISFAHKDFQYKIFSYINIIYLFYLMAIFSNSATVAINVSLSFFGFVLAFSGVEILHKTQAINNHSLNSSDKVILGFLLLCLFGGPLSSSFLNNFAIFGSLYKYSPSLCIITFVSIIIAAASLIEGFLKIKTSQDNSNASGFLLFICFLLVMSFIKPFWFVEL